MNASDHTIVIGSGLGGLAAAATLAARGRSVTVLEEQGWLGGKAAELRGDGYRFDMGPTILTVPAVLERIFAEAGEDVHDALDLVRLPLQWRCFFEDGSVLDLEEDPARMAAELERFAAGSGSAEGYGEFLSWSKDLHRIAEDYYFWRSVGGLGELLAGEGRPRGRLLADLVSTRPGRSVAGSVRGFVRDARVAQMLDHYTQYVGSSPEASPAILCSMAHLQSEGGVWYPRGGTRAVPEALIALGERLGVAYRTNAPVARILLDGRGAVRGVELADGSTLEAGAVVSNMDSVRTHDELLPGRPARRFARRKAWEPACSGVVMYLGLSEGYDHLAHHDFVFSADPAEEFDAIYRRGEPAEDPTVYVCAPARTDPSVAPAGGEALYLLVHTPYLRPHHRWEEMFPRYRRVILDKLARCAGLEDLEDRIRFEDHLTPQDIHDRYRVLDGAIYGLATHGRFTGALKPGNRSPDVPGLYLAGGSAHPGPGMPMVMMSGWIAADCADQDAAIARTPTPRRALGAA
jgi:diapolycopene oxygenase